MDRVRCVEAITDIVHVELVDVLSFPNSRATKCYVDVAANLVHSNLPSNSTADGVLTLHSRIEDVVVRQVLCDVCVLQLLTSAAAFVLVVCTLHAGQALAIFSFEILFDKLACDIKGMLLKATVDIDLVVTCGIHGVN